MMFYNLAQSTPSSGLDEGFHAGEKWALLIIAVCSLIAIGFGIRASVRRANKRQMDPAAPIVCMLVFTFMIGGLATAGVIIHKDERVMPQKNELESAAVDEFSQQVGFEFDELHIHQDEFTVALDNGCGFDVTYNYDDGLGVTSAYTLVGDLRDVDPATLTFDSSETLQEVADIKCNP